MIYCLKSLNLDRLLMVIMLTCLSTSSAVGQPPKNSVEPDRVSRLIQQLGADSFQVREQAQDQLLTIGLSAQVELAKAIKSPDLEIRFRARRIYVQLLQMDFQRRLTLFVNDVEGKLEHDLPGWKLFREQVGTSAEHRKLFASMVRVEAPFLMSLESKSDVLAMVTNRLTDLQPYGTRTGGPKIAKLESIAVILLASNQLSKDQLYRISSPMYNLLNFQETKNGIRGGPNHGILKGMVASYIERSMDLANSQLPLTLVLEYGFEETGVKIGRKILKDATAPAMVREYAAICLARFGTKADIPKLLPMLSEKDVIHSWSTTQAKGKIIKTQLRDAILLLLLHQTDQDYNEYGYRFVQPSPITVYRVYSAGFIEDAVREKAHAQWNAWWAKNKASVIESGSKSEK